MLEEKADGNETQALRDRPQLDMHQAYYYSAYQTVARGRQVSMGGPLAVPVSEIESYCRLLYIQGIDEREQLLRNVICIDNAYLEWMGEQREKIPRSKFLPARSLHWIMTI